MVISFLLLTGRLYQLQIVQGGTYRQDADENRFRLEEVSAPRGVIYDRSGQILTRNRPSFEVAVVPDDISLDDGVLTVKGRLTDENALKLTGIVNSFPDRFYKEFVFEKPVAGYDSSYQDKVLEIRVNKN